MFLEWPQVTLEVRPGVTCTTGMCEGKDRTLGTFINNSICFCFFYIIITSYR